MIVALRVFRGRKSIGGFLWYNSPNYDRHHFLSVLLFPFRLLVFVLKYAET